MNRLFAIAVIAAAGGAALAGTTLRAAPGGYYAVTASSVADLGTLGGTESSAYDVNNLAQIVGWSRASDGRKHAFLRSSGLMTDVDTSSAESEAHGINASGIVAGYRTSTVSPALKRPVVYEAGTIRLLGLPTAAAPCSYGGVANAINDLGAVAGTTELRGGCSGMRATSWASAVAAPVIISSGPAVGAMAAAINNAGSIVGSRADLFYSWVPFHWNSGVLSILAAAPPAGDWDRMMAAGINQAGYIAGSMRRVSGVHAARWNSSAGTPLVFQLSPGGDTEAFDVNAQGFMAGHGQVPSGGAVRAFVSVSTTGGVVLPNLPGASACQARALNDLTSGQLNVVGECTVGGLKRAAAWIVRVAWVPLVL